MNGKEPLIDLTEEVLETLRWERRREVLGEGASGKVLLVDMDGALCCLKLARHRGFADMYQREFHILRELDGTAGAPIPLGTSSGYPALLTTFCGRTTFKELSSVAPTDKDKVAAFTSLVRNVQQLHRRRYTHNDIKDDNVVVRRGSEGQLLVSLIDYGLARKIGTKMKYAKRSRLTRWIAPELKDGALCVPSVDVFSLGNILNGVLAQCDVRYPSLEGVAWQALSEDPAKRPSLAQLLQTVMQYRKYPRIKRQ